jgi:hypothetical protein
MAKITSTACIGSRFGQIILPSFGARRRADLVGIYTFLFCFQMRTTVFFNTNLLLPNVTVAMIKKVPRSGQSYILAPFPLIAIYLRQPATLGSCGHLGARTCFSHNYKYGLPPVRSAHLLQSVTPAETPPNPIGNSID